MTNPVDLTNLRSMTDGDVEMEKALFEEFYSSFETGIEKLHTYISGDNEAWRKEAHALKGITLNLGAAKLGELCKDMQENYLASTEEKRPLLENLRLEYAEVKKFLSDINAA